MTFGLGIDVDCNRKLLRAAAGLYRDENNDFLVGANWDITKSTLAIENLNDAQRLGQIGNWPWDVHEDVVDWSDQTFALFGINKSHSKIDLKAAMSFYTEESQLRLEAAVKNALVSGTAYSLELETRDSSNGVRYLRGQGRARFNADGVISGLFGTVMNITESKLYEESLCMAKVRSEAANISKREFLANMSHEIRTPMTAILGYADLLEVDGELTSDREQALDAIRTIKAINDILDMSKLESGKMSIESIESSPRLTINEVANLVRCQCEGKRLGLHVIYESSIPKTIKSDPTRLRQILLNLVGNAIKFTEMGSVTISVLFCSKTNSLRFAVIDTGIGMSPTQRDRIPRFEAFSQADSSTTRNIGGSGLGLRICNSLANMLGGEIACFMIEAAATVKNRTALWNTPTLLLYSGEDRCVCPSGSTNFSTDAPASLVESHVYEKLRHEILKEAEDSWVYSTLFDWLDKCDSDGQLPKE